MGSGNSSEAEELAEKSFKLPGDLILDKTCKKAIRRMKLKKRELAKLWEIYKRINDVFEGEDDIEDTSIDLDELCAFLEHDEDSFMENFFELMDTDNDGVWEFGEFLLACGKFLCGTQDNLIELCFLIFDNDKDGYLGEEELIEFIEMVHGEETIFPLDTDAVLKLYDSKQDGFIDFLEFEEAAKNYPLILWKIQDLKKLFENRVCGHDFWLELFLRIHPDYLDDFYDKWKQGLKDKCNQFKTGIGTVYTTICNVFRCICFCFVTTNPYEDLQPDSKIDVKEKKKNTVGEDVFPDAKSLELRLNMEADNEYEESDNEDFKRYVHLDEEPNLRESKIEF